MMHLRQPLQLPKGRELRVLIHARFSTEEQRQSSIDDQITACRAFLDTSLPKGIKPTQIAVEVIKEPEISGEIADRPGINEVWTAIESKRGDLIVAEESSRLYRHPTKAGELFESAVDAGVRVICPSDYARRTTSTRPMTTGPTGCTCARCSIRGRTSTPGSGSGGRTTASGPAGPRWATR